MTIEDANKAEKEAEDKEAAEELAETIEELEPLTYFGTDFDIHGLVRRLNSGDVVVPSFDPAIESGPGASNFQRKFVWKKPQMDKFVESLLLGFPIPGIFLVQQPNKQLLVLDGQQRLRTLQQFYAGKQYNGNPFTLERVESRFAGLDYESLEDELRRQLDNTFIHATIVKYSSEPRGHESIYSLFERLNSGGTNLYPQEIRVALYQGPLVEYVRELNTYEPWREIFGPLNDRLKDHELILRFLAFWQAEDLYARPLKSFLNDFLSRNRSISRAEFEPLAEIFKKTCDIAVEALGRKALRPESQVNAAFSDAVLIGLAHRIKRAPIENISAVNVARDGLLKRTEFRAAIARATADEARVKRRLQMARDAFGKLV